MCEVNKRPFSCSIKPKKKAKKLIILIMKLLIKNVFWRTTRYLFTNKGINNGNITLEENRGSIKQYKNI